MASKPCAHCGEPVRPYQWDKWPYWETESSYAKRSFCGKSCAKKAKNPMHSEATRLKVAATHRRIGHQPTKRGGNGRGLTEAQSALLRLLSKGWAPEHSVMTGPARAAGDAYHYKIDLAHPIWMIAVEIDGGSHGTLVAQARDKRKDVALRRCGWKVLRLSNAEALSLSTTSALEATRRILQAAS